jgi:hypothetical protein
MSTVSTPDVAVARTLPAFDDRRAREGGRGLATREGGEGECFPNPLPLRGGSKADRRGGSANRLGEAMYVGERSGDAMVDMTGGPVRIFGNGSATSLG